MNKIIVILLFIFGVGRGIHAQEKPVPDKYGFIVRAGQMAPDFTIRYADGSIFYSYAAINTGVARNVVIDETGKIVYLTRLYNKEIFAGMVDKINELLQTK